MLASGRPGKDIFTTPSQLESMITKEEFKDKVRRKIKGWYSCKDHEDKAIERISRNRDSIVALLEEAGVPDTLLEYLDSSGFYYRASSPNGHHNYPGGLAEHCYGTYTIALEEASRIGIPKESVIKAALLHDLCKADRFWFKGRSIHKHTPATRMDDSHSVRSVFLIGECGMALTEPERLAIRWHMKGFRYHSSDPREEADHQKAVKEPLWRIVFNADKKDASMHPETERE